MRAVSIPAALFQVDGLQPQLYQADQQSWACVSKIMSRLAPVRLFQTVSRLALSRIFKQKIRVISLSRHRVSRQ